MFGRAEARDLKLAACNGGWGEAWGTASRVHWRPPPCSSSVVEPGTFSNPSRRSVWPRAARHQAERGCPASGAAACPRLLLLRGRCALPSPAARSESSRRRFFLSPLLLSPSHSPPPRSHVLPALCKCPWPPRASRCREVSGGSGSRGDSSRACGSQPLPPPAGREKRRHSALGCGCWREAVPA